MVFGIRYAQCLDPKDKIFSVLSLAPKEDGSLLFLPDYHLSTTEMELVLAKSSLLGYQSLNALRHVDTLDNEISISSWVPRWSVLGHTNFRPLEEQYDGFPKDSAHRIPAVGCSEEQTIKLLLKGRVLTHIGWTGDKDFTSRHIKGNYIAFHQHELNVMREYSRQMNDPQGFNMRGHVLVAHLFKPEHTS